MYRPIESHNESHAADSLICAHAFSGARPVLFVYREEDGFWTFTCGTGDHSEREDVIPVCHGCALDQNDLWDSLGDLKPGWEANRTSLDKTWRISQSSPRKKR